MPHPRTSRQLVYYVATSLDGFIAASDGDFSAFGTAPETLAALFSRYPETCPAHVRAALGVSEAPRRFDTVLMGYRTFAPALDAGLTGGAYPHLRQMVVTHRELPEIEAGRVETLQGDVAAAVAELKSAPIEPGRPGDLWLCGGGELAAQLVEQIDEVQLKVNPIAFGRGVPVLPFAGSARSFELVSAEPVPGGVVLLTYVPR